MILYNTSRSLRTLSTKFHASINLVSPHDGGNLSTAAICKARQKIHWQAFEAMNHHVRDSFYKKQDYKTYLNHRVLAFDGTKLWMNKEQYCNYLAELYGDVKGDELREVLDESDVTQANIVRLHDPLNGIIIDQALGLPEDDERTLAASLFLKNIKKGDLIICDRGYPAAWFYHLCRKAGADFVIRMPINRATKWQKSFLESDDFSLDRELILNKKGAQKINKTGWRSKAKLKVKIRVVKVILDNGDSELIATSLSTEDAPDEIFKELYFYRWPIETSIDFSKSTNRLESWGGMTANSLFQDLHAENIRHNLSVFLSFENQQFLDEQNAEAFSEAVDGEAIWIRKYCFKDTVSNLLEHIRQIFFSTEEILRDYLKYLSVSTIKQAVITLYGRSNPRRKGKTTRPAELTRKLI